MERRLNYRICNCENFTLNGSPVPHSHHDDCYVDASVSEWPSLCHCSTLDYFENPPPFHMLDSACLEGYDVEPVYPFSCNCSRLDGLHCAVWWFGCSAQIQGWEKEWLEKGFLRGQRVGM